MIFYFSGTGNSQLVANQIAELIGDKVVSINQCLKDNKKMTFQSDCPLVFVMPTYAWRMPKIVRHWILDNIFEGNNNAYYILTCGGSCGNAAYYAKKLCKKAGMNFNGLASVIMPENYVAMFDIPNSDECNAIIEAQRPFVAELASCIQKRMQFKKNSISFGDKLLSGTINTLYYPLVVHDKGFNVSEKCISCKKCFERCPLNNIDMIDGKPVWKGNCTHCMACIGGCPTAAIEYKSKWGTGSKGKARYYIMKE